MMTALFSLNNFRSSPLTAEVEYAIYVLLRLRSSALAERQNQNSEVNSMENTVSNSCKAEKGYLAEFDFFDGDSFVTFNIIGYSTDQSEILVAVTDRGKISLITYDILTDKLGRRYFAYGCMFDRIYIDDFVTITESL